MQKRGLTPALTGFFIILALIIAIVVVIVIIYNLVNLGIKKEGAEELVDLDIVKNSVEIIGNTLYLKVEGDVGDKELKKIKFVLNDGISEEEITLDASGFQELGEKDFEVLLGEISADKTISISIVPIVKSWIGEKELDVADTISVTPQGDVGEDGLLGEDDEISTNIIKCSDCSGLSCDRIICHSIIEGCYYEGGLSHKCTACSLMSCNKYDVYNDCIGDKCELGCEWWNESSGTGNVILNLFRVITGRVVSGSCIDKPVCGDGDCTGSETYLTCLEDCEALACAINGATQECGTDVGVCQKGNQTCTDNVWGQCEGDYVGPSNEICDGLDNDCDGVVDESLTAGLNNNQVGVCSGSKKTCGGVSGWQNNYTEVSNYEVTEISCSDGLDNDCDGLVDSADGNCVSLLLIGESCSLDNECDSEYCVDGVCCTSSSCLTCQSCNVAGSEGICTSLAIDTDCGDNSFCDGSGNCLEYNWYRTGEEYVLQSGDWCEWGVNNFNCLASTENNYGWTERYLGTPYSAPTYSMSDVQCRPWVNNDAYVGTTIYKYQCQRV